MLNKIRQEFAEGKAFLQFSVLTGGTDNHMILINVANSRNGLTGVIAQKSLEDCGIIVDKTKLPFDERPSAVTSGIRLGTPIVTKIRMGVNGMERTARLADEVLKSLEIISETEYKIDEGPADEVRAEAAILCGRFLGN